MAWRLAPALDRLRQQVNGRYINRSKASDGSIGDARHATRKSDHNPSHGVVHALDLTHDPKGGFDSYKFAEHLRQSHDPRLKYVISNRKIASAKSGWHWRRYSGANPHDKHVHISVTDHGAEDDKPWSLPPVVAPMGIANLEPELPRVEDLPVQDDDDGIDEPE